jgi:GTP-sensing pleiotropic transcriptional regulator CodY
MRTKTLLAMFGMIASTFALFIKVMAPSSVQFVIEGNIVELNQVPSIYSTLDVLLIGASCFVLGASLIYLLQADGVRARTGPGNWDQLIEGLTGEDERKIVQIIADEGGTIFQSQLVERSGFSKSKVSIVLDRLEARGILERRRHGMSNAVVLK